MADLKHFLTGLAHNSAEMKAFQADPHAAMQKAGISAADQKLVTSKDAAGIVSRLKGGAAAASPTVIVVVV